MKNSLRPLSLLALAAPAMRAGQQTATSTGEVVGSSPVGAAPVATTATATRATRAPVIDGRADDPAWADAAVIDGFRTFTPVLNGEPRFRTEARVLYDDKNLYVLV